MDFHFDPSLAVDTPLDIVNAFQEHISEQRAEALQDAYGCVAQHGTTDGAEQGHHDYVAGYVQDHPIGDPSQAIADCQVQDHAYLGPDPYMTMNPYAAAAQILFLPSEANVGEAEHAHAQGAYANAYSAGYHEQASRDFDQGIVAHFQEHAPPSSIFDYGSASTVGPAGLSHDAGQGAFSESATGGASHGDAGTSSSGHGDTGGGSSSASGAGGSSGSGSSGSSSSSSDSGGL